MGTVMTTSPGWLPGFPESCTTFFAARTNSHKELFLTLEHCNVQHVQPGSSKEQLPDSQMVDSAIGKQWAIGEGVGPAKVLAST